MVSIACAPLKLIMVVSCSQGHCDDGFNVRYLDVNFNFPCDSRPSVSSQPDWTRLGRLSTLGWVFRLPPLAEILLLAVVLVIAFGWLVEGFLLWSMLRQRRAT